MTAHFSEPVGSTCAAGVGGQAVTGQAFFAVFAEPAANVERQANPVAHLDTVHACANLDNFAHVFMAENTSGLERRTPFVHVQIRATDIGGRHSDKSICRLLYFRIRHVFDTDVARTVIDDGFHVGLS